MSVSPVDRIRLEKAAVDEGFGVRQADDGDWLAFEGLGTPAAVRLTRGDRGYLVGVNHPGVVADLKSRWPSNALPVPPVGFTAFVAGDDTEPLHHLVRDIWRLARSLPIEPLRVFEGRTRDLPRATEAERLVIQRVGQDVFRDALMDYWGGKCAVTGVCEPRLLRASHIKPWKDCETDAERLDVYNGLLLAAHLDAAFDAGLISFADTGEILLGARFAEADRLALGVHLGLALCRLAPAHRPRLAWHRTNLFR